MTNRGRFYDEGGSNQATQAPMCRSATVQEGGSGKRVMAFTPLSTPAERLKAVEIDIEKGRTRTKQSKVNTRYYFNPEYMYREHQQAPNDAKIRARARSRHFWNTFSSKADQQSQCTDNSGSGGDLSPPSTADGSGDRGNGGNRRANDIGTSQSSRPSSRDVNPIMSDHNSKRGEEYEKETIAHTYRRLRKVKDKASNALPNYDNQVAHKRPDEQQISSTFTMPAYCNWSCGSNNYNGGPYNYGYNQTNAN
ncbi:hypothetical protein Cgig2_028507 [Carnegiea gigantea]|uniref:Uncharacterized protein n=1 Tax=Carnegiea gigantea TaxID=171969 RepID=A0A9Q1GKZ5_9CARY|nr:hypothetical protein Cgig2_028507 [Carnegiea gigantea]